MRGAERSLDDLMDYWLRKERRYDELVAEYFPVNVVEPGKRTQSGRLITNEASETIERARRECQEAWHTYREAIRRSLRPDQTDG